MSRKKLTEAGKLLLRHGSLLNPKDIKVVPSLDMHDSSELFNKGERVTLEVIRPKAKCGECGSNRLRSRLVDFFTVKRVKVLYCPDCGKEKKAS